MNLLLLRISSLQSLQIVILVLKCFHICLLGFYLLFEICLNLFDVLNGFLKLLDLVHILFWLFLNCLILVTHILILRLSFFQNLSNSFILLLQFLDGSPRNLCLCISIKTWLLLFLFAILVSLCGRMFEDFADFLLAASVDYFTLSIFQIGLAYVVDQVDLAGFRALSRVVMISSALKLSAQVVFQICNQILEWSFLLEVQFVEISQTHIFSCRRSSHYKGLANLLMNLTY